METTLTFHTNGDCVETIGSESDVEANPRFGRVTLRVGHGADGIPTPAEWVQFPGMAVASGDDVAANASRCVYLTPSGTLVLYAGGRADADGRPVGRIAVFRSVAELRAASDSWSLPPAMLAEAETRVPGFRAKDIPNDFDAVPSGPREIDSPFNRMRYPDVWSLPYRQLDVA